MIAEFVEAIDEGQMREVTGAIVPGRDGDAERGACGDLGGEVFHKFADNVVAVAADFSKLSRRGWRAEGLAQVGFGDDGVDG